MVVDAELGVGVGVGSDVGVGARVGVGKQLSESASVSFRVAQVTFQDMGDKYAALRRAQLYLDFIHANS